MELMGILTDVTGSGKSKMAVYKPELSIYKLIDEIERRFQRKTLQALFEMSGNSRKKL